MDALCGEYDWLRLLPLRPEATGGELNIDDFGLEFDVKGLEEGDSGSRLNGLLRCFGPLEADVDMLSVLLLR